MTSKDYLVALISATPVAIPPAAEALSEQLPQADVWNLLDDRLLKDAADAGGLTEPLAERMRHLIAHAVGGGADAVLLTCSMYGQVAQQTSAPVPVLAPDEAAFAEAGSGRYPRVLVVASLESALADSMERFGKTVTATGQQVQLRGLVVPAAFEAAVAGDQPALVAALTDACRPEANAADAVLLAQYSLAPAQGELTQALGMPVIAGPQSAAVRIKDALTAGAPAMAIGAIGAIADDYTGGTDIALAFRKSGLRTLLFFGTPQSGGELPPHEAIVIALKSRTTPPAQAVADTLDACRWLAGTGKRQLYFKYCSTFDSTPAGNIGPVLDALAEEMGTATVLTTPSSPEHGRTVYSGHLFVDGMPLADSHMAHHPLTPMTDSDLTRVLRAQSSRAVTGLTLATVRGGVSKVRAAIADAANNGAVHVLADAVDADDLRVLARAVADQPLIAGAAGLAGALATARATSPGRDSSAPDPVGTSRAAVLAGSCSVRTLEQVADYERHGNPSFRLDALPTQDAKVLSEAALAWVDGLGEGTSPLIYTSLPPSELHQVQKALGVAASAELLESALAQVAIGLWRRGVRRFVLAGGETSGAIVDALRVHGASVGKDVAPGVPWVFTLGHDPLALLLKSGNFGDVALFSRAVEAEQDWGVGG